MDISEKLKYYKTDLNANQSEATANYSEMAKKLGGEFLDLENPDVVKIKLFLNYDWFISNEYLSAEKNIQLSMLTKNQFQEAINTEKILILDLETTGLMGGAGTYPFLIGFGLLRSTGIEVIQYFLPDYGREHFAYNDLKKNFADKNILLSYNGKSYDLPLLRNRFILNRIDDSFENFRHLDLLHIVRRLWKNEFTNCSLENVEKELFKFSRWRDIEGALIPSAYFKYLSTGDLSEIKRIIQHNQQDIISLAALLFYLHQIENHNENLRLNQSLLENLCNLSINNADIRQSEKLFQTINAEYTSASDKTQVNLSILYKRKGHWQKAIDIWEDLLNKHNEILFAAEELAKFYEHHEGNPHSALLYAKRAKSYIEILKEIKTNDYLLIYEQNILHRIERLKTKIDNINF